MKVEIEVEPGRDAYTLALTLADHAANHEKLAYEWWCRHGVKDEVYDELIRLGKWFSRMSRDVAKQTAAVVVKPVEGKSG